MIPTARRALAAAMALATAMSPVAPAAARDDTPYFRFQPPNGAGKAQTGGTGTAEAPVKDPPSDPGAPLAATASLPSTGRVSTPYLGYLSAAEPATFSEAAGSQAIPGVTLTPAGRLSGTPTRAGTYRVSYVASAGSRSAAIGPLDVTVLDTTGSVPVAVYGNLPATGTVGVPYVGKVEASNADAPTYALAADTVPGLGLAGDGTYSGTPTAAGSYQVSVRVTSASDGASAATTPVTLVIAPAPARPDELPLTISAVVPPNGRVNSLYAANLSATGVSQPAFAYAQGSDVIPGVRVKGAELVGYPTRVGEYDVAFTVTGADGRTKTSATSHVRVDSLGALTIDDSRAPVSGRVGDDWTYNYNLSFNDGQYMWQVVYGVATGSLPPGVSLDEYGNFVGSPSAAGSYPVSYFVRTGDGRMAFSEERTVVIRSATDNTLVGNASLPEEMSVGREVRYYDERVMADSPALESYDGDGNLPYRVTASGSLPDGIAVDENGLLSGTATRAGTFKVTYLLAMRDGSASGATREYTYVVSEPTFRITTNKTRDVSVIWPDPDPHSWENASFDIAIEGGQGPFTVTAERVSGNALAHADPSRDPMVMYSERSYNYFYTQREPGETVFRFCAKGSGASSAKVCTMDLSMRWETKPFNWTVQMDDPAPACVSGKVPYSYTLTFEPRYDEYTVAATLTNDGRQGEDLSARKVEKISDGIYRVSGVMDRIGTGATAYDLLTVTNSSGVIIKPETQQEVPTFSPQFGSCDREAMIGGPMAAGWDTGLTELDARDYPNGLAIRSILANAYGGVQLVTRPTRASGVCYAFDHDVTDVNGDSPPWQLTRSVYLSGITGSASDCHGSPDSGEVTFTFMDALGRTASTPTITLKGW